MGNIIGLVYPRRTFDIRTFVNIKKFGVIGLPHSGPFVLVFYMSWGLGLYFNVTYIIYWANPT